MKYIAAVPDMVNEIYDVLHTAIKTIYPKYYPKEVVDFFCNHHNREHFRWHSVWKYGCISE